MPYREIYIHVILKPVLLRRVRKVAKKKFDYELGHVCL